MKNLILGSTSTVYATGYLEHLKDTISIHFKEAKEIVFIPFARPGGRSHDSYTEHARPFFNELGIYLKGIHEFEDPAAALQKAQGIFTGGGNTFVLVNALYQNNLLEPLRRAIFAGVPYLGTSAGSNIAGVTMHNTNDMPIVHPPSFKTLGAIPFNINAHYQDPDPNSKHMGESRETRIKEFHTQQNIPVVGIREGSWLQVTGEQCVLKGPHTARIFRKNSQPYEAQPECFLEFS
ncbi:MAG: dipeptidase PepE [Leeuwenhoekiella sp.]